MVHSYTFGNTCVFHARSPEGAQCYNNLAGAVYPLPEIGPVSVTPPTAPSHSLVQGCCGNGATAFSHTGAAAFGNRSPRNAPGGKVNLYAGATAFSHASVHLHTLF